MAKEKKRWSLSCMLDMLRRENFVAKSKNLQSLSVVEWNAIGDWLYHVLHPQEKDNVVNRPVPNSIGTIFHRRVRKNWMEILTGHDDENGEYRSA